MRRYFVACQPMHQLQKALSLMGDCEAARKNPGGMAAAHFLKDRQRTVGQRHDMRFAHLDTFGGHVQVRALKSTSSHFAPDRFGHARAVQHDKFGARGTPCSPRRPAMKAGKSR